MPKLLARLWKNLLEISNPPTKICKICCEEIKGYRLIDFISKNVILCPKCASLFKPIFKKFQYDGCRGVALYRYDETIRTYLYQFKGCFDYELYPVFLYPLTNYLRFKYRNYVIVPIPSFIEDDEKRGFNHVEMIFSMLNLEFKKILIKTEHHKQAECNKYERKEIYKYMKVKENVSLTNEKVLLVDDVCTSGSTLRSAIKLIRKLGPKEIKMLVLSKAT